MTGPAALTDSISAGQAGLLEALESGPLTRTEMTAISGLGRTMVSRHMTDLVARGLVEHTKQPSPEGAPRQGHPPLIYSLTPAGGRALLRHQRKVVVAAHVVVPPPTFTTCGQPYEPPKQVYYRNSGNRHIASAGVGC